MSLKVEGSNYFSEIGLHSVCIPDKHFYDLLLFLASMEFISQSNLKILTHKMRL